MTNTRQGKMLANTAFQPTPLRGAAERDRYTARG
jgi:hypothetical protein